jgi:hypothetical protein
MEYVYISIKNPKSNKFICSLFYFFSNSDYRALNGSFITEWWIGKDLEGSGHGLILGYDTGIFLDGLRKTMKSLDQDSQSQGRDLNLGPPEYKAGVLTTWPQHLV